MKRAHLLVVPAVLAVVAGGTATALAAGTTTTPQMKAPKAADTLITMPDQGYTPVYDFMKTATRSLDMTMYELTDTTAEQDLGKLAAKGVKVRVILDRNREKSHNQPAYTYLSGHGVSVVWANTTYAATHQKTITVDGTTSMILTGNLTSQYYSTSRDFAVIDPDSADVGAIEKVFDADFAGSSVTPGDGGDLVWSPTDSQRQLLALIGSATRTIQVENEEMADPAVVTGLESAAGKGVRVQVTMTYNSSYSTEYQALSAAGVKIATYAQSASLYIHAKAIVADSDKAFLGSENFSDYSLNKNRELGLITTDPTMISSVSKTLTSDFDGGKPTTS